MSLCSALPGPFDQIVERMLLERPKPLGKEPVIRVRALRRVNRYYSDLLAGRTAVSRPQMARLHQDR